AEALWRITVEIANTTPFSGTREEALKRTFCSTHTVLRAPRGSFVSLTDPPEALREAAEACRNEGTWPVLVEDHHTLLSSPIILEDFPQVAPESPGDIFDRALAGRVGVVESIEQDMDDAVHLVVVAEDDPGRDLGERRQPGHRFFFATDEVEPLGPADAPAARILVAGVGNVFLGDDGFGVALAGRLAARELPAGVKVVDYGIRGMDLAYALGEGWDAVVLLDATPRGRAPGTLYVIEA